MLRELRIGDMVAKLPIIQGGMGVGVSLSRLAGAVAKEGGVGVISTAQIGFEEPEFEKDQAKANLIAIKKHIKKAKEIACGHGMVGVNIMVALKHYKEHVLAAVEAGADVIISGAGLPMELPELVDEKSHTRIAPIVSSKRAANLILKMWAHRYNRTADFIVIEGPKAGGHLGFSNEQLADMEHMDYDSEIKEIISCAKTYEEKFKKHIPVIVAGGVFTHEDVMHCMELGADGVQVASRFVATEECDASDAYKHAYLNANESDVQIIQSPVGMPGRAVRNEFIRGLEKEKQHITKCYNCLEKCNPATCTFSFLQSPGIPLEPWTRLSIRKTCPSFCSSTSFLIIRKSSSHRLFWCTVSNFPVSLAAFSISSRSAEDNVTGFSDITFFPACMARMAMGLWQSFGVAIRTTSISGSASMASSVSYTENPFAFASSLFSSLMS